jgi:uncharacterized protein (TIGR03435 family)
MTIATHPLRRSLFLATAALVALSASPLVSQSAASPDATSEAAALAAKPIEWDIAVFKLNKEGVPPPALSMPVGGDGLVMKNRPMRDLIRYAYNISSGPSLHFSNQPAWIDTDRWDVQAKVADTDLAAWVKFDDYGHKIALRAFLAQWLKLTLHYDTTEYPCYALQLNKGLKMKEAVPGDSVKAPDGTEMPPGIMIFTGANEITAHAVRMNKVVQFLSGHADRTIIDQTGLQGAYNFVLKFDTSEASSSQMTEGFSPPFTSLKPEVSTPIEFSAVKENLGLKLVPSKAPIEGVVIDHVERPPDN